jgi:hypothetical protein
MRCSSCGTIKREVCFSVGHERPLCKECYLGRDGGVFLEPTLADQARELVETLR